MRKAFLQQKAKEDVREIALYIADDNLKAAEAFRVALERARLTLADLPEIGRAYDFGNRELKGLAELGVDPSHSRPRVSNDNPFSESQFKTLKYQPDFPGRFRDAEHARTWCANSFHWYTLADVFYGRIEALTATRQTALERPTPPIRSASCADRRRWAGRRQWLRSTRLSRMHVC